MSYVSDSLKKYVILQNSMCQIRKIEGNCIRISLLKLNLFEIFRNGLNYRAELRQNKNIFFYFSIFGNWLGFASFSTTF